MFSNYFKLAIKVLRRNPFFTFISLFGISFTLMALMLIASFLQTELGSNKPLTNKNRLVFLDRCDMLLMVKDTIYEIDSSLLDGKMVYDTINTKFDEREEYNSYWSLGYYLMDKHLRDLETAQDYAFYSANSIFDISVNNNKLKINAVYTDDGFWRLFDFEFLEGQPYVKQQVDNQESVAIISSKTRDSYFGVSSGAVGKEIELDKKRYRVIGVVEKPLGSMRYLNGDVFLPITHVHSEVLGSINLTGGFEAAFLVETPNKRQAMKDEIKQLARNFVMPTETGFNRLLLAGKTFEDQFATQLLNYDDRAPEKSTRTMTWILVSLLSLFILVPTLNLINLNLSRIAERSDEIGVRKAFGATSSGTLVQFVFENVILTLLGGIIGLMFALVLFNLLNNSKALGDVVFHFNWKVFLISVLITVVFGVISGIIPAFRMSRLHVIQALKQNQL